MFHGMHYVYEVYKERSFTKAAQNLYISQPSLSAMIKKTENEIGTPIFDRSTNPIQLTECGKRYIKSIEEIMDIQNNFENYVNNIDELRTGQIAIGGSNLFASFVLPPLISKFTQKYPFIRIRLVEAHTAMLEKQLAQGALDLVIDNYAFSNTIYDRQFFAKETLLLAVPKSFASNCTVVKYQLTAQDILANCHLSQKMPAVPLSPFREDPFIFLRSGNDTRIRAEKICQQHDLTPHIILKLDQQITSYNVACYGMGIAFVSDTVVRQTRPDPNIIFYKLHEEYSKRDIFFYHKHTKYITRAVEEFLKISTQESNL